MKLDQAAIGPATPSGISHYLFPEYPSYFEMDSVLLPYFQVFLMKHDTIVGVSTARFALFVYDEWIRKASKHPAAFTKRILKQLENDPAARAFIIYELLAFCYTVGFPESSGSRLDQLRKKRPWSIPTSNQLQRNFYSLRERLTSAIACLEDLVAADLAQRSLVSSTLSALGYMVDGIDDRIAHADKNVYRLLLIDGFSLPVIIPDIKKSQFLPLTIAYNNIRRLLIRGFRATNAEATHFLSALLEMFDDRSSYEAQKERIVRHKSLFDVADLVFHIRYQYLFYEHWSSLQLDDSFACLALKPYFSVFDERRQKAWHNLFKEVCGCDYKADVSLNMSLLRKHHAKVVRHLLSEMKERDENAVL